MSGRNTMSLEAAMDEERLAILEILERQAAPKVSHASTRRSDSPATNPRSPVRSMLDVGPDTSPPPAPKYRSMLDVDAEMSASSSPGHSRSARSSVSEASPRSTTELSRGAPEGGAGRHASPNRDPLSSYKFGDIITSQLGQSLPMPKRNQQAGRSSVGSPLSQAQHAASPASTGPGAAQLPRHNSIAGPVLRPGGQSTSPHSTRSLRGSSPQPAGPAEKLGGRVATLDSGHSFDLDKAYKNLSNAHLLASEGPLVELALRRSKGQDDGEGRLQKAYMGPDGEALGSSSEDDGGKGDDEDDRGRRKAPRIVHSSASTSDVRQPRNQLEAADDERKHASQVYKVRSLFDDEEEEEELSVPGGMSRAAGFPASTVNSANNSENEIERDEIKKAQSMAVKLTDVFSDPFVNRSVKVIYRGDFTQVAAAAVEEEHKKLRKYLVATDMSEHSAHALEWAIGTVLRDGDTLVVVRCLDEESEEGGGGSIGSVLSPSSTQQRSSSISALTSGLGSGSSSINHTNGGGVADSGSSASSAGGAGNAETAAARDRMEEERRVVAEEITGKVSKLLRRTKLQVRVIVEVIHCKNPKHLVLEMIDLIKPMLVILGSRGRSAIKGVILGSFSNYLVTKSSVPVMVARKRLRKKSRRGPMRQVNNLSNPSGRSLARGST